VRCRGEDEINPNERRSSHGRWTGSLTTGSPVLIQGESLRLLESVRAEDNRVADARGGARIGKKLRAAMHQDWGHRDGGVGKHVREFRQSV